jgi:hypothetical protein
LSLLISFVYRSHFIQIVVAQHTNLDPLAALLLQMAQPLSMESLVFLFVRQNLSRATTADPSGAELVKDNSTCTKIQCPKEMHKMNFLILSPLFLLPRWPTLAKPIPDIPFQVLQGPRGRILPLAANRCLAFHPRIPWEPTLRGPLTRLCLTLMIRLDL